MLHEILGPVLTVGWLYCASILIRKRHYSARQVITAPSAVLVRLYLVVAVGSLGIATSWWPILAVVFAMIAWELVVQAKARVRRARV